MKRVPVIVDTDIGDDIDDALALALLLRSPEVALQGVTTVFRDAPRRAQFARALLAAYGRAEIPVAAGVSRPLLQTWEALSGEGLGRQFEALPPLAVEAALPHALDWTLDHSAAASEVAGPLVLLCIGPLTNAALLLTRAPHLASRLQIVAMGGLFEGEFHEQAWEWNIHCDPEAAAIVLRSGAQVRLVPLDVTRRCVLTTEQCALLEQAAPEGATLLGRLVRLWRAENHGRCPILHDPLAALTLFSDVVTWHEKRVEVGLCGASRGVTRFIEGQPNCRVAVAVDAARAVHEFMRRLG